MKHLVRRMVAGTALHGWLRRAYWWLRNANPLILRKKRQIASGFRDDLVYLNIGAFVFLRPHWRTLDYSSPDYPLNPEFLDYNFDLTSKEPLPFADASVDLVYSSHTFEHILKDQAQYYFAEVRRILKPGGSFRMVVPDMEEILDALRRGDRAYLEGLGAAPGGDLAAFVLDFFTNNPSGAKGFAADAPTLAAEELCAKYYVETLPPDHDYSTHAGWFTAAEVARMWGEAGFPAAAIRRSAYLQSRLAEMRDPAQFDQTKPQMSLYMEVTLPAA